MEKNKDQALPSEDDLQHDELDQTPELDNSKEPDELTRRKVLKSVLSASTLIVINPFLLEAESKSNVFFVTVTPTPTTSATPSMTRSLTPTRTPTLTPTTSPSLTATPTMTRSLTATLTPTLTPTTSPSLTATPTMTRSLTATRTPTLTPTTSPSLTPSNTPTPTPSTSSIPLPVEISEFGVTEEDGLIKLYWKTETEQNNQGFEIQRSTNALLFNKIGWVDGGGDSTRATSYNFEEINVESNQWYYYRLRQIDMNGTSSYSKTIAILINEEEKTRVKDISPTIITENYVNIDIAAGSVDQAEIVLNGLDGQLVASKSVLISKGNNTIRIDLPQTPSGLYFVHVKFKKGKTQTKRFVLAR